MKRLLALVLLAATLLSTPVLAQSGFEGLSGELRIVGSEVGLVAFREAAEKVMAAHPGVKVTFALTGAGIGLARLRMRQADICLYDRDPSLARTSGEPLRFVPYGVDPVAVVLNPVNTVGSLSLAQVTALFSGKMANWSQAGGGNFMVVPIYIEASEEPGRPETRPGTVSVSSQPAMRFTLMRYKEALAITSARDLDGSLKPVALDGALPGAEALKAGRYRLYRVMHAAVRQAGSPLATAFLDYMNGPEGQAILEQAGYLPLAAKPDWPSPMPVGNPDLLVSRAN